MLQPRAIVNVADNTGAKRVGVFKVLGGTRHRYAQIGDIVVVSVKEAAPAKEVPPRALTAKQLAMKILDDEDNSGQMPAAAKVRRINELNVLNRKLDEVKAATTLREGVTGEEWLAILAKLQG